AAAFADLVEDRYLRESTGDDWVGVQSYTRNVFGPDGFIRDDPEDTRTLTGWEYWPTAVGEALRHTAGIVGDVPMIVTENGIATDDDERRIAYTDGALSSVRAALDDGLDVRGYLHWSLLDNYEWGSYTPTFGLVAVDRETFRRTVKPSARWLGDIGRGIPSA
ncbi:MAG TPA: family 1 glycosylhydrolase, partial [Microthrixaceae bacterium]|nr:family 1 glycosylhydrolase [Microthrixaceae bacterium]